MNIGKAIAWLHQNGAFRYDTFPTDLRCQNGNGDERCENDGAKIFVFQRATDTGTVGNFAMVLCDECSDAMDAKWKPPSPI